MEFTVLYKTPSQETKTFFVRDAPDEAMAKLITKNARTDYFETVAIAKGDHTKESMLTEIKRQLQDDNQVLYQSLIDDVKIKVSNLNIDKIQFAIDAGIISIIDIVNEFKKELIDKTRK